MGIDGKAPGRRSPCLAHTFGVALLKTKTAPDTCSSTACITQALTIACSVCVATSWRLAHLS